MLKPISLLIAFGLFLSCGSDELKTPTSPEAELKEALEKYKAEDYELAKTDLYKLTIKYSGTRTAEDAQYYLAETNLKLEKYLVAAHSYLQILERYSASEYLERAQYKEALCYFHLSPSPALDQKYTVEAIRKLREFVADWKSSEYVDDAQKKIVELTDKLAEKKFNTASLYFKMEKWRASTEYADFVIREFIESKYVRDSHLLKARVYTKKKQWVQAEQELDIIETKFPEHKGSIAIQNARDEIENGKRAKIEG